MKPEALPALLERIPHTRYHAERHLLTWHPRGILDDELADEIVGVLQSEEDFESAPFHRYTDLSGLTSIRLQVGHVFQIADDRRQANEPVKSAFYAETIVSYGIARMYEALMEGGVIEVRAFRDQETAAAWLGVPLAILREGASNPSPTQR